MAKLAKRSDVLSNRTMKSIYINANEEIIKTQNNYYMKYKKTILNFNNNISQLRKFLIFKFSSYFYFFLNFPIGTLPFWEAFPGAFPLAIFSPSIFSLII